MKQKEQNDAPCQETVELKDLLLFPKMEQKTCCCREEHHEIEERSGMEAEPSQGTISMPGGQDKQEHSSVLMSFSKPFHDLLKSGILRLEKPAVLEVQSIGQYLNNQ